MPEIPDGGKVHADAWSTEQDAALLQTSERKRRTYARILNALDLHEGLNDDELRRLLAQHYGPQSKSGPATRRGELVEMGLVRPQRVQHPTDADPRGEVVKRPSDLGGAMIVWELVPGDDYTPPAPRSAERQPNPKGLAAAQAWAEWEIGDAGWAAGVIRAYLNPDTVNTELEAEQTE